MKLTPDQTSVARILRVNYAGEYGAIRIYGAQIAVSRRPFPALVEMLEELRSHEIIHCQTFTDAMPSRGARPCRAMGLWSKGGWLLGFLTALMGPRAIWTCTEAVEDVVHEHLDAQLAFLLSRDVELHGQIAAIQEEEAGHLSLARQQKGSDDEVKAILDRDTAHWAVNGFGMFLLHRTEGGAFMGGAGLSHPDDWPSHELTWWLMPEARGTGFATEASRAVIDWAYTALGWPQVETHMRDENAAAHALAKRLGGSVDRRETFPDGVTRDVYVLPERAPA